MLHFFKQFDWLQKWFQPIENLKTNVALFLQEIFIIGSNPGISFLCPWSMRRMVEQSGVKLSFASLDQGPFDSMYERQPINPQKASTCFGLKTYFELLFDFKIAIFIVCFLQISTRYWRSNWAENPICNYQKGVSGKALQNYFCQLAMILQKATISVFSEKICYKVTFSTFLTFPGIERTLGKLSWQFKSLIKMVQLKLFWPKW